MPGSTPFDSCSHCSAFASRSSRSASLVLLVQALGLSEQLAALVYQLLAVL